MLVIGIAGGTGSGKTTVVNKIISTLPAGEVAVIPQDSYYKDSSHIAPELRCNINFDEPAGNRMVASGKTPRHASPGRGNRDALPTATLPVHARKKRYISNRATW